MVYEHRRIQLLRYQLPKYLPSIRTLQVTSQQLFRVAFDDAEAHVKRLLQEVDIGMLHVFVCIRTYLFIIASFM